MKKKICAIIAISCAIAILGAAGSCDAGSISALKALRTCVFAIPTLYVSLEIGGFLK